MNLDQIAAGVYEWACEPEAFGRDPEDLADLTETLDPELLGDLYEHLTRTAAVYRTAATAIAEQLDARLDAGPIRVGDQAMGVSRSAGWRCADPAMFWASVGSLVHVDGDELATLTSLFNPNTVRVTALRAAIQKAGFDAALVDEGLLERTVGNPRVWWRELHDMRGVNLDAEQGAPVYRKETR